MNKWLINKRPRKDDDQNSGPSTSQNISKILMSSTREKLKNSKS